MSAVIQAAKANRMVGETRANAKSSRSHMILRIKVETIDLEPAAASSDASAVAGGRTVTFSVLNLVDLAGSERVDKSGSSDTALRMREALNINKSLLCLGNVVTALADRSDGKKVHIPYRDSKLTRLLEDSLGGSARTALIACITSLPEWHLEQTRATLDFAARAGRVVCKPQKNVVKIGGGAEDTALVSQLQQQLTELKSQLAEQMAEAEALRRQLVASNSMTSRHSKSASWSKKFRLSLARAHSGGTPSSDVMSGISPHSPEGLPPDDDEEEESCSAGADSAFTPQHNLLWRLIHHNRGSSAGPELLQRMSIDAASSASSSNGSNAVESSVPLKATTKQKKVSLLKRWSTFTSRNSNKRSSQAVHQVIECITPPSDASFTVVPQGGAVVMECRRGRGRTLDLDECREEACGNGQGAGSFDVSLLQKALQDAQLRDHIIRQLIALLQQKKAEVKSLKQQVASLQSSVQAAMNDRVLQEAKMKQLVDGISQLSNQRQTEFQRWQAHLATMETSLVKVQQEGQEYRCVWCLLATS